MPQKLNVIISTTPAQTECQNKSNKDIEIDFNHAA